MKHLLLAVLGLWLGTHPLAAQMKIGYTNPEAILAALPDAKKVEAELKAYQTQIETELKKKNDELRTKMEAFQKIDQVNTPVAVYQAKAKELQTLRTGYEEFLGKAEEDMQAKQASLLAPISEKIEKAITEVAKAEGFDYVFNTSAGGTPILLFAKDTQEITNKVIVKLGGTPITQSAMK
ncbi:MAG: OmpH family outer membrane protein [Bernardetiaceae bacterium]|nr:OmpH family outer membrane protein [Bernardetiaceae bacterium]